MKSKYRIVSNGEHFCVQKREGWIRFVLFPFMRKWTTYSRDNMCVGFFWPDWNKRSRVNFSTKEDAQKLVDELNEIDRAKPKYKELLS